MAPHPDYPRTRLYLDEALTAGATLPLDAKRAHYVIHVLRQKSGDKLALFNGRDGEWLGELNVEGKKHATVSVRRSLRPQHNAPDLWLLAAPLKGGKSESVLEKATELGISRFCPVTTHFTIVDKVNIPRLETVAVEAAEQCERLDIPAIEPIARLEQWLGAWKDDRRLIYGDESGRGSPPNAALSAFAPGKYALLIGPEGGFSARELDVLRSLPFASGLSLGPRILRADTAAIAALALVQSALGDWEARPAFRTLG